METIKIVVTKEMISRTEYSANCGCGLYHTMRDLGYNVTSVAGHWVRIDGEAYKFLGDGGTDLSMQYYNKETGQPFRDAIVEIEAPPKINPEPKGRG